MRPCRARNGIRYRKWVHVDGWSDEVLDDIARGGAAGLTPPAPAPTRGPRRQTAGAGRARFRPPRVY